MFNVHLQLCDMQCVYQHVFKQQCLFQASKTTALKKSQPSRKDEYHLNGASYVLVHYGHL